MKKVNKIIIFSSIVILISCPLSTYGFQKDLNSYKNVPTRIVNFKFYNSSMKSFEKELIELVNIERENAGLPPLNINFQLSKVAYCKSQDMSKKKYLSHESPTYGSPFEMMQEFKINYTEAGENICKGCRNPKDVMKEWMNSPCYRINILNPSFTEIGVGVVKDKKGEIYCTELFIKK